MILVVGEWSRTPTATFELHLGSVFLTIQYLFTESCLKSLQPNLVGLVGYTCHRDDTLIIALRGVGCLRSPFLCA